MIRIASIGLGNRACKYLEYIETVPERVCLTAAAESHPLKRARAAARFGLDEGHIFESAEELFNSGIELDAVIIASPDKTHHPYTVKALEKGWHVLLEKPAASNIEECLEIERLSKEKGLQVHLCYVLRFHPLYIRLKEILDSGIAGKVETVNHKVNVGLDRMSHTFVRGLWSKKNESSPIVLSKLSHDIDIIHWLTGEKAVEVSSKGSLELYTPANAPEGSTERCIGCPVEKECRFSAPEIYLRRDQWNKGFNIYPGESKEEAILRKLRTGRFGRCVYKCDNDVNDYQELELKLENSAQVRLIMDGRCDRESRETVVNCVNGRISTDGRTIEVFLRDSGKTESYDMSEYIDTPLHGGADITVVNEFLKAVSGDADNKGVGISSSIHSHRICYLADKSERKGIRIRVE